MKLSGLKTDPALIQDILDKSMELQILNMDEVNALIALEDKDMWERVFQTARLVKEKVYGRRIVLFAPLYVSNECMNDCLYCGFRTGNSNVIKKTLSIDEAVGEARLLSSKGYKRLLLVASEHPLKAGIDYLERVIDAVYAGSDVRILHVNAAPMSTEEFRRLKAAGAGVYQCFQETYHIPSYRRLHTRGAKTDYEWRVSAMDRAIEAGFEDVGMGVLLGLYDWKQDVAALIGHSLSLIEKYGFGPHTLSVPRLQPAEGMGVDLAKYRVSDDDLKKVVAIYRLALPYAGVVISTRESAALRDELLLMGASQLSAGSKTSPLGYIKDGDTEQFEIGDRRSLEEVIGKIIETGLLPSLCTACYREGRSGATFRNLAQSEAMEELCNDNALLSLKEYFEDSSSDIFKEKLRSVLKHELENENRGLAEKFELIEKGARDLHK